MQEGSLTKEDEVTLETRKAVSYTEVESPHLYLSNQKVNEHNSLLFEKSSQEKVCILAHDTVIGNVSVELRERTLQRIPTNPAETMQLHSPLQLAVGLQYDVSINIRTKDGLTNGASCIFRAIHIYGNKPSGLLWVKFNKPDIGQMARQENRCLFKNDINDSWTPIHPTSRQFSMGKSIQVLRTQFPLRPATTKIIHRSQGDTIKRNVLVDFAGRSQPNIHYVGISRVDCFT